MKLKQRVDDFRVRELLAEGVLGPSGSHRVYRVTKRKLTTLAAAEVLARTAGAAPGDVSFAGLKDRQGVTVQHMALHRGRDVQVLERDLRIEGVGFCEGPLEPGHSEGNAFEVVARDLGPGTLATLRANLPLLREQGLVNYFDEQRFGNLRHEQGWIALMLLRGEHEQALKALLASISPRESQRGFAFKTALRRAWGDWHACRDVAGRFGEHHSVFEHLKRHPGDFAGAFFHVASRLRLIHLYAFQSHLWNRAVAEWVRRRVPLEQRVVLEGPEGPLVYPSRALEPDPAMGNRFRIPGPRLEDVEHPEQRALYEDLLAQLRLVPARFDVQGVPGFQLKGEDRALLVVPRHLRVRPAEPDPLNRPRRLVRVRFELPRGAYATLVVRRLAARPLEQTRQRPRRDGPEPRGRPQRAPRPPRPREGGTGERGGGYHPRGRRGPRRGPGAEAGGA